MHHLFSRLILFVALPHLSQVGNGLHLTCPSVNAALKDWRKWRRENEMGEMGLDASTYDSWSHFSLWFWTERSIILVDRVDLLLRVGLCDWNPWYDIVR